MSLPHSLVKARTVRQGEVPSQWRAPVAGHFKLGMKHRGMRSLNRRERAARIRLSPLENLVKHRTEAAA